jgi:hypothetical protein
LAACKKEITVIIPDREADLVVNALFSTDSLMEINLSSSQNITNNATKPDVIDASIQVFDKDSNVLNNMVYTTSGNYKSTSLIPKTGVQYLYKINVNAKTYWVNETMPDSMSLFFKDTSRVVFQGKEDFFQFRIEIEDPANQSNYYGIRVKRFYKKLNSSDTSILEEWSNIETVDFILTENPKSRFSKKHLMFKDDYMNGNLQQFNFGVSDLFDIPNQKTTAVELNVSSYSKSGYEYYTSLNEHLLYQKDPFSQPTLLDGNVSGAFGAAIGSFTRSIRINLK